MTTKTDRDALRDQAALYALGTLPADEARNFESRLAAGDTDYRAALEEMRSVVDDLGYAAPPQAPPPELRARLLARVAAGAMPPILDYQGIRFVRSAALAWQPGAVAGLERKQLTAADSSGGRTTALIRLEPGTAYPGHRHAGVEELYLLEGDLRIGEFVMRSGDYCRAEPGTQHPDSHTVGGCLLIVTNSDRDELLA